MGSTTAFAKARKFAVVLLLTGGALFEANGALVGGLGSVVQPVWVDAPSGIDGNDLNNIINQSGLNTPYVSGVTDFDSYTAVGTAEWELTGRWEDVMSGTMAPVSVLNFDLGADYLLNAVAIWNNTGSASLLGFDILVSSDLSFTNLTSLGSFTIDIGTSTTAEAAQVNSFAPTPARYVQLLATRNGGFPRTRINEIAFGAAPIPEPGTVVLAILAGSVLLVRRRASGEVAK